MDHSIQQTIQQPDNEQEQQEQVWDELHRHQTSESLRHYNNSNNNEQILSSSSSTTTTAAAVVKVPALLNRPSPPPPPPLQQRQRYNNYYNQPQSQSVFQQINHDIQRVRTIVYDAAQDAYHQSHERQQQQQYRRQSQQPNDDTNDTNGDYHSISNGGTTNHYHHQNSYRRRPRFTTLHSLWHQILDWKSSSTPQHYYNNNNNNNDIPNPNAYFAEFGIPDPSLQQPDHYYYYHHHNNNNNNNNNNFFRFFSHDDQRDQSHTTATTNNNDYIHLPNNLRFPHPENDGWASVSDLDVYFQNIYYYYYHRGLLPIITRHISDIVTIYFTFALSILLFVYIDWHALSLCIDETTCQQHFIQHYIKRRPFHSLSLYNIWIILYIIVFGMYCIVSLLSLIHTIQIAIRTKYIYEEKLGISSQKLQNGAVDWDRDVVQKFITLQESGQYRIVIPKHTTTPTDTSLNDTDNGTNGTANNTNGSHLTMAVPPSVATETTGNNQNNNSNNIIHHHHQNDHNINALMIANRILRKENFMIALFNRQILNLSMHVHKSHHQQQSNVPPFFCSSIEWSIYFCVLNFLFNHKYQIRPSFYLDPAALRRRFQICGIMHIVLMPFLLFFMTLYFGLQNIYDWKSTKQYLGPREWSMSAKWTFREFNELPHFFERRLAPSYDAAETYVDLFGSNEYISALGRICVFIGGSLGAVLLAFAAMNDAIVLHVKIGDWNLLWYGGMFGILYSAGKAMIPKAIAQPKSARNLYAEMDTALVDVANHTHYYPDIWVNRGWDYATYSAFSSMFRYKIRLFLTEIISLILAPYILCVSLADCAESICELVLSCRAEMSGVGDVCGFATFDFSTFQDEGNNAMVASKTTTTAKQNAVPASQVVEPIVAMGQSLSESILQTGNVEESIRQFPKPKARYGKMLKSFVTFQDAHPSWTPVTEINRQISQSGDKHARHLNNIALSALRSEVDLHRIAAARQLETLERIEEGRSSSLENHETDLLLLPNIIDESYIPIVTAEPTESMGSGLS